jgi:hypothetical protein
MSEKDLQKEKIERAGRRLLGAGRVRSAEIEKIVAAPHLFDSVKARIKAEQSRRKKAESFFPAWNFQTAAGAFAVLIVLLAFAAVIFVKTQNSPQIVGEINKPLIEAPIKQSENPTMPEITKTNALPSKNQLTARKADFKAETPKPVARTPKISPPKTAQTNKKEPKQVFYPLAFGGTWEANGEDLRIVRAELSRSELFALGVNLPVENESARIKTDLLVGADGVARAIRLVE